MTEQKEKIQVNVSAEGDCPYVMLPAHPGEGKFGVSAAQLDLRREYGIGKAVDVILDLDEPGEIIGIDIMLS